MATKMTKNIGTISLTANEIERVTLPASYGFVWVKNMSDGDIYFSLNDEFTAGEDGVIDIPKGECARLQGDTSTVYLLGSGSAIVVAQNFSSCPFKLAAKGGEGGGSSPAWNVDSALSLFSENPVQNKVITSEINKKADVVDIPSSLPANGGNADTVNGHSVNADVPADAKFTDTVPDLTPYALKSLYGDTTINVGRRENAPVGEYSTSLGIGTVANGYASTAEGSGSQAAGYASHAGGCNCQALKEGSFAHGYCTEAKHENEVAFGKHNVSNADTLFSIGDGVEINTDGNISIAYHNAFEITTTGGMLHDKDILTSAHCIQFMPYNMKYYALNDRILLFANDDDLTRGIYFVNNTPNDITVCALISASAEGPAVQYGYGSNTYPEIQNTGEGREWLSEESIPTSPTIFSMVVPSGKLGYYGVYHNSETAYTTVHDIRCPYFNFF